MIMSSFIYRISQKSWAALTGGLSLVLLLAC
jgi:hypothetical protein